MRLRKIFFPILDRLGCKEKQEKISLTTYMNLYLSVSLLSSHISVSLHSVRKCTQCYVVVKDNGAKTFFIHIVDVECNSKYGTAIKLTSVLSCPVFFNGHYLLLSFGLPQRILILSIQRLCQSPIQYDLCFCRIS